LTFEAERLVVDLSVVSMARPTDIEADARRDRRRASAFDRVEEIVIVPDGDVRGVEAGLSRADIDVQRRGRDGDRPEQA
jgi:hypothetical protein